MIPIRSFLACAILLGILFATACTPNNPSGDTTPPGFLEVLVRLEKPNDPNVRGEFNITSQDVTKDNLSSDLTIHILATAGDSESGITGITLATQSDPTTPNNQQNLLSQCSLGRGSEVIGVLTGILLPFALSSPPSPPPSIWKVDATADPIAATGCAIDNAKGAGPVNISGFIRLIVTNGAGQTATSGTFIFDYADVGSK